MSKNRFVLIIGVLLLLIPMMGFPRTWENFFHIIFGLCLVGLSFSVSLRQRVKQVNQPRRARQTTAPKTSATRGPAVEIEPTQSVTPMAEEPTKEPEPVNKEEQKAEQTQI